jgi:3-oxoacyl-[acyl-carrier protein] reductase
MTVNDTGRLCVVVGGAGGIGSATCRALAEAGRRVVVVDFAADKARELAAELKASGFTADADACDVTGAAEVESLRERIETRHGPADILINLAGVARNDLLVKVKDEDFAITMATHVNGTLNTMRAFLPGMRKRGFGRVVNTSSTAARGSFGGASYATAKGAIEAMSRTAALEMARFGVTVNCIAPGLIRAGIFLTVPEDYQKKAIESAPIGRAGEPREVAACVNFLASDDAGYVTGQTLYVCGGLSIGPI